MSSITQRKIKCPKSLYKLALASVAQNSNLLKHEFKLQAPTVIIDILEELQIIKKYGDIICTGIDSIEILLLLLKLKKERNKIHLSFQNAINWNYSEDKERLSTTLANEYTCQTNLLLQNKLNWKSFYENGLTISDFFSEAGWFIDSALVLRNCLKFLINDDSNRYLLETLDVCQRLLHSQNGFCFFDEAKATMVIALDIVEQLKNRNIAAKQAVLYTEISVYHILQSNYKEAYEWSIKSVSELFNEPSIKITEFVDVLCQAGKTCVLKRDFKNAALLIKEAVAAAKYCLGEHDPKYAKALNDYAFYLLNVDMVKESIEIYQKALEWREATFPGINILTAISKEDTAYASYVMEYSSGFFDNSRLHAEEAIKIYQKILPPDHLLLSSCKRVLALIIEEIAIDDPLKDFESKLLEEAYLLHNEALEISRSVLGEMNVQTAKHYGNLGRLLQTMKKLQESEEKHLKAIEIKEIKLGPYDYEVSISKGHLASLYTYDMNEFEKAESLYLRSIEIGLKLFGESYSGLEYDYRGLARVYYMMSNHDKAVEYRNITDQWMRLRETKVKDPVSPLEALKPVLNFESTARIFLQSVKTNNIKQKLE